MFRRSTLLLILALAWAPLLGGCSDAGSQAPPDTEVAVGGRTLVYQPPQGWEREEDQWFKFGEGRLNVVVFGPDVRRLAAERVEYALGLLGSNPQLAERALVRFPTARINFDTDPEKETLRALARQVREGGRLIPSEPDRARALLAEALEGFRQLQIGDDPEARAHHYLESQRLRGGRRQLDWVARTTVKRQPAAMASTRDAYGSLRTSLFLVLEGELVVFELSSSASKGPRAVDLLMALGSGLQVRSYAPRGAADGLVESGMQWLPGGWRTWLKPLILPALFLLFAGVPAWFAAGSGYDASRKAGADVRRGAAGAAFLAASCGILAASILVSVALMWVSSGSRLAHETLDPQTAWARTSALLLMLGLGAGVCGGGLAAGGAYLGAGTDRSRARWMAATVASLGMILGPRLLDYFGALPHL